MHIHLYIFWANIFQRTEKEHPQAIFYSKACRVFVAVLILFVCRVVDKGITKTEPDAVVLHRLMFSFDSLNDVPIDFVRVNYLLSSRLSLVLIYIESGMNPDVLPPRPPRLQFRI